MGGSIEAIVGCMFSGKTEELMRLLRRSQFAKQRFQVFKPRIDDRYSLDCVASHDRAQMKSIAIDRAAEIYRHLKPDTQVVGIDEGQFLDEELVDVATELASRGLRVIVAGLDTDWKGEPFGPMPNLMAVAERVTKLQAVCVECGAPASRTQRLDTCMDEILVGDASKYEARCRHCHEPQSIAIDETLDEATLEEASLEDAALSGVSMRGGLAESLSGQIAGTGFK
jgi:thymidine kinase